MTKNALQIIQQKLKAPKSQYNNFGKYSYRNQEDILEAVKPLLSETESTLIIADKLVDLCGSVFVESTATLIDKDGKEYKATAAARHAVEQKGMNDSQITGSTSSYARKYALNGLFLIDDTKDADATNDHGKGEKPKEEKKPSTTAPVEEKKPVTTKKEWLNPGTPNWEHAVKRIKEGASFEDVVKKFFLISKANETKLLNETKQS